MADTWWTRTTQQTKAVFAKKWVQNALLVAVTIGVNQLLLRYGTTLYNSLASHNVDLARVALIIAVASLGGAAYWFKRKNTFAYGLVELVFGILYAGTTSWSINGTGDMSSRWATLAGCVYIVARGLNNVGDARKERRKLTSQSVDEPQVDLVRVAAASPNTTVMRVPPLPQNQRDLVDQVASDSTTAQWQVVERSGPVDAILTPDEASFSTVDSRTRLSLSLRIFNKETNAAIHVDTLDLAVNAFTQVRNVSLVGLYSEEGKLYHGVSLDPRASFYLRADFDITGPTVQELSEIGTTLRLAFISSGIRGQVGVLSLRRATLRMSRGV